MTSSGTPVSWPDLPHNVFTDKIPPGWYVGCELPLDRYLENLKDWREWCAYEEPAKQVAAVRARLRGNVAETMKKKTR